MRNIIEEVNIGYSFDNIKKIVNTVADVLDISASVYVMPLKLKSLDDNGYAIKQGGKYILFVSPEILSKDRVNDFNIKLFIHELTHVQQMERGDLVYNSTYTKITWKGKKYDKITAHEDRPFEIEARRNERKYYKQIKELL